jgi:hypothetical protein
VVDLNVGNAVNEEFMVFNVPNTTCPTRPDPHPATVIYVTPG